MSEISNKKKKFIKRNYNNLSLEELSRQTGLKPHVIRSVAEKNIVKVKAARKISDISTNNISPSNQSLLLLSAGAAVLFLLTFVTYLPALKNGFVWDDIYYISNNTLIRSLGLDSVCKMLTSFNAANWHPLTWLSHAIDYAIWGLDPFGHHLTNIIIHGLNSILVFLLTVKLILKAKKSDINSSGTGKAFSITTHALTVAGITAILFALHPLHVESVAWVAERKDLLCGFFFLSSVLSYLYYTSSGVAGHRQMLYGTCLLMFILSLMSKPMSVTLPVTLLLIDIYPLKRISLSAGKSRKQLTVILEKFPFFFFSTGSGIITIFAQNSGGAIGTLNLFPLDSRLLNASRSLVFYLLKITAPFKLVALYPYPRHNLWLDFQYVSSALLVLSVTGLCLWLLKRGKHLLPIVWFYYLITLLPVIGIIQVGDQAAADRYTYLPSISIFLLTGIGISLAFRKCVLGKHRGLLAGIILLLLCMLLYLVQLTNKQIKVWHNSETLWSHALNAFPFPNSSSTSHYGLGSAYGKKGMVDEAISEFRKALVIRPLFPKAYNGLGNSYIKKGMLNEAISEFRKALAIWPGYAKAHNDLGVAFFNKGMMDTAIAEYNRALELKPDSVETLSNLGVAFESRGMLDEAISRYRAALTIDPDNAETHSNLAIVYGKKGRLDDSIAESKIALTIEPNLADTHFNLALTYYYKGDYKSAIVHCDMALNLGYRVTPKLLKLLEPYR